MAYSTIIASVSDHVGLLCLNRPEARNAINQKMFGEMLDCLEKWEADSDVAVVVLTGGEDFFAAGLDLEELKHHSEAEEDLHQQSTYQFYRKNATYRKPLIAALAGPVIGGGADIAEFCDFRFASENVTIGWPQIKFGWITFIDPLWKIVGLSKAKELQWTGRIIDVKEAEDIKLIDRVVPYGKVVEESVAFAKKMARSGSKMLLLYKELATHALSLDPTASFCYTHAIFRGISNSPATKAAIETMIKQIQDKKKSQTLDTRSTCE